MSSTVFLKKNEVKKRARDNNVYSEQFNKKQKNENLSDSENKQLLDIIEQTLNKAKQQSTNEKDVQKIIVNVYYAQILWAVNKNLNDVVKLLK